MLVQTRVIPQSTPAGDRGALVLACVLGAICGALSTTIFITLPERWSGTRLGWVLWAVTYLVPTAAYAAWTALRSQRSPAVFRRGFCFWAMLVLGAAWAAALADIGAGAALLVEWPWPVITLIAVIVLGLAGAALHLVVKWFACAMLFVAAEQDGTLCWKCGYTLGADSIDLCPECATPRDPRRFRAHWVHRLDAAGTRHARSIALAATAVMMITWAAVFVARGGPGALRFVWRFRGADMAPGIILPAGGQIEDVAIGRAPGVDLGEADHLLIMYAPLDHPGVPAMQIRVARLQEGAGVSSFLEGPAPLFFNLTRPQAEYITRFGLTEPLLKEIRGRMDEVGWSSAPGAYAANRFLDVGDAVPNWP